MSKGKKKSIKRQRNKKCKPRGTNSKGVNGAGGRTTLSTVQKALLGGGVIASYLAKKDGR